MNTLITILTLVGKIAAAIVGVLAVSGCALVPIFNW